MVMLLKCSPCLIDCRFAACKRVYLRKGNFYAKVITTVETIAAVDNVNSITVDRSWEEEHSDRFAQKSKGARSRKNRRKRRDAVPSSLDSAFPKSKGWSATQLAEEFENDAATINPRVREKKLGRQNVTRRMKWDMGHRLRKEKYQQLDVTGDYEVRGKPPNKLTRNEGGRVLPSRDRAGASSMSATGCSNEQYRSEKDRDPQSGRLPSVRPTLSQQNNSDSIGARDNTRDAVGRERIVSQLAYQTPDKALSTELGDGLRKDAIPNRRKGGVITSKIIKSQELCDRSNWPLFTLEKEGEEGQKATLSTPRLKGIDRLAKLASQDGDGKGTSPVAVNQQVWGKVRLATHWQEARSEVNEAADRDSHQQTYERSGNSD